MNALGKNIGLLVALAILRWLSPCQCNAQTVGNTMSRSATVQTEAEGSGTTPELALKSALKGAVRQVNGTRVDDETRIENHRLVYDRQTSLVEGSVQTFTILSRWSDGPHCYCRISAKVRRGASAYGPSTVRTSSAAVDGAALFAATVGHQDRSFEGRGFVGTALRRIPETVSRLQLVGPLRIVETSEKEVVLAQDLQLTVDPAAYAGAQQDLAKLLQPIAEECGIFTAESELVTTTLSDDRSERFAQWFIRSKENSFAGEWSVEERCDPLRRMTRSQITRLPSRDWTPARHGRDQLLVVMQVHGAGGIVSGVWRWFRISRPKDFRPPALSAALTLRGTGSEPIVREEFRLGPGLPGLSLSDVSSDGAEMQSLVVAPSLTYHVGAGYRYETVEFSRSVIFTRRFSMPIDQLPRAHSITCDLKADPSL